MGERTKRRAAVGRAAACGLWTQDPILRQVSMEERGRRGPAGLRGGHSKVPGALVEYFQEEGRDMVGDGQRASLVWPEDSHAFLHPGLARA